MNAFDWGITTDHLDACSPELLAIAAHVLGDYNTNPARFEVEARRLGITADALLSDELCRRLGETGTPQQVSATMKVVRRLIDCVLRDQGRPELGIIPVVDPPPWYG